MVHTSAQGGRPQLSSLSCSSRRVIHNCHLISAHPGGRSQLASQICSGGPSTIVKPYLLIQGDVHNFHPIPSHPGGRPQLLSHICSSMGAVHNCYLITAQGDHPQLSSDIYSGGHPHLSSHICSSEWSSSFVIPYLLI